jgi:predicted enzyme related to lactoylglutathione lyase
MANQIVWCDIPVKDLDRAIKFYSAVIDAKVEKQSFGEMSMGVLPHAGENVSGGLSISDESKPSADGPLIYLNCENRLDAAISAVGKNGGKILKPKHQIAPCDFRAVILDSEGNRIAFKVTNEL